MRIAEDERRWELEMREEMNQGAKMVMEDAAMMLADAEA